MSTTTTTVVDRDYLHPRMYSSLSSLTSSHNQPPSVPRVYKQASQLFLTRRICEALKVLEPVILPSSPHQSDIESDTELPRPAPVASATKNARCKVWGLYVSILNEVVELGAEEGKRAFGSARWKELVNKTRDGSVWEEVVRNGYSGSEGLVDAEVVAILATLLLAHAPSQRLTQQRLETYLSVTGQPNLDIATYMAASQQTKQAIHSFHASGTSTPRDLNQRLKILEIYTLYVLPRNEEWEYARHFIQMSEVLDEDRKEAFLQALQALQDEPKHEAQREEALKREREEQLEHLKRREEEERRLLEDKNFQRQQDPRSLVTSKQSGTSVPSTIASSAGLAGNARPRVKSAAQRTPTASSSSASSEPAKRPKAPPSSFYKRTLLMVFALQQNLMRMGRSIWRHPVVLFRMMLFIFALIMALARRDIRERVERTLKTSWEKVRRTVSMGVRVSYI